ncbi:MAG: Fe-S-containing protein, partial [bacterium]|nr:Fe-S-containing protein [bacterium]
FSLVLNLISCTQGAQYPIVEAKEGTIRIPLADIGQDGVHFFTYRFGDRNIEFFVRRSASGAVHTAFNACFTCYKYGKGFHREDDDITCSKCGTRFTVASDEWVVGGCTPIQLPHQTDRDFLIIAVTDLQSRARLF